MTATLTYTDTTAPRGPLARLRHTYAQHRLYHRTLAELEGLNDRELQDLGLSRYGLRQIAYESVYGA